ncbi:insulinase family protein [bacterium]|nr:insulinase family protein [candidate division CSSED10-310 bacterium]
MITFKLPNGVKVVQQKQKDSKAAALMYLFHVGSVNEPPRLSGVSHFLEHMIFKGTERFPGNALTRKIQEIGGDPNAFTSFEMTAYIAEFSHDKFGPGILDLWLDALQFPRFESTDFKTEKKVVIEEIKMKLDMPGRRSWDLLREMMFKKHRYGMEVKGYEDTLNPMQPEDMRGYWADYYRPDNCTLLIVGDYESERLFDMVGETLTGWRATAPMVRDEPEVEPPQTQPRMVSHYSDIQQAYIKLGFHGPTFADPHTIPLALAFDILSSGRASRLHQSLVQTGACVKAGMDQTIAGLYPGMFEATLVCSPDKIDTAMSVFSRELRRFMEEGPDAQELTRVKNSAIRNHLLALEGPMHQAIEMAMFDICGCLEDYGEMLDRIQAVTAGDVKEALTRFIAPDSANLLLYLPEAMRGAGLEKTYPASRLPELLGAGRTSATSKAPRSLDRTVMDGGAVLIRDHFNRLPLFACCMEFKGGVIEENRAIAGGTALFVNGMMRARLGDGRLVVQALEELGASMSPMVDQESFGFIVSGLKANFSRIMDIVTQFLAAPTLDQEAFELERINALARLKSEKDNLFLYASRMFQQGYYGDHPFGLPETGFEESVQGLELRDLQERIASMLHPSRAVLAFSGSYSASAAMTAAQAVLDALPSRKAVPLVVPAFSAPQRFTRSEFFLNKQQVNFVMGFPAPPVTAPEQFGMKLLSAALSASGNRFWTILRDEKGLCYVAFAHYVGGSTIGHMEIYVGTSPDREREAIDTVVQLLDDYRRESVDMEELNTAKEMICGGYLRSMEHTLNRASRLTAAEVAGLPIEYTLTYPDRIRAFTPEQYAALKKRILSTDRGFLAVVKPPVRE